MVEYKGASASVKEVIILIAFLIGIFLLIPYIVKYFLKNTGNVATELISDAAGAVSGAVQPKLDEIALDSMPTGIREVEAITPELSPAQFPSTNVGPNKLGIPETSQQSQPYVDWLKGSSEPYTGYLLTQEQDKAFMDPVGDARTEQRIQEGLDMMERENKPWFQFW